MTREEIEEKAGIAARQHKHVILELPTGYGKTKLAIDLVNELCDRLSRTLPPHKNLSILLLVAKRVHKQTWLDEIKKWGGLRTTNIIMECYESLRKHKGETFDILLCDECFRGDTEILTDKGFKKFESLDGSELVAQFTDSGDIEFVKPIRYIKRMHTGDICKWHLGRGRYCYLTPNHNQVYCTKAIPEWRVKPIKDLNRNSLTYIPISGKGTGNNEILSPIERLFIAIQADGTLQRHQKKESVYSIQVTKDRKKRRLKNILKKTCNYTQITGDSGTDRYMVKLPKGDAKLLSTHFDINMGYLRANSFIDEVVQWDGYIHLKGNMIYYSSKNKENADFVAAVALQAGYKVLQGVEKDNRKDSYSDIHRVYMRRLDKISTQPMKKEYLPYNDYVYCVEVPSHKIVVRSEGYSFISGNCHHINSETRLSLFESLKVNYMMLGLSATVKPQLKAYFRIQRNAQIIKCTLQDAIDEDVLPEPKIYVMPIDFDDAVSETIILNGKKNLPVITIPWKDKAGATRINNKEVHISCTKAQYLMDLCSQIEWYKNRFMHSNNIYMKNMWLKLCGDRLKWLAKIKNPYILNILRKYKNERTLTFCASIEQTEVLGKNCIHSKNRLAQEVYESFNNGKIKHITSCQMLNEGINLKDCRIGIYANIHASETITRQRMGRLLRHKSPIVIIPYWRNTREEELVDKMLEEYDKKLIFRIRNVNEIIL